MVRRSTGRRCCGPTRKAAPDEAMSWSRCDWAGGGNGLHLNAVQCGAVTEGELGEFLRATHETSKTKFEYAYRKKTKKPQ